MRRLFPYIGWFYIALGIVCLFAWFLGSPSRYIGHAAEGQLGLVVAGGLLALIVFGILMVVGEAGNRER